jgi:CheY-like chemotaxis protein
MDEVSVAEKNKRYVLVLDPDVNDRFATCMLLQRFGCNIFTAGSVDEAVDFMTVAPPSAVVADRALDDSYLVSRISQDPRFLDVPIILLTSSPDPALEKRCRIGEIAAVLRKPLNVPEFYRIVQTVIEKGSRRNIRIRTHLVVKLEDGQRGGEGDVTVLSEHGMFFRTLEPRPANTRIPVSLEINGKPIKLEAVVLYTTTFDEGPFKEPGMGLKFVNISREDRNLIAAFIIEQIEKGISR